MGIKYWKTAVTYFVSCKWLNKAPDVAIHGASCRNLQHVLLGQSPLPQGELAYNSEDYKQSQTEHNIL